MRKVNDGCLKRVIIGTKFNQNSEDNKSKLMSITPKDMLFKAVMGSNPKEFDIVQYQ